jgi:hypothetical protein
VLTEIYKDKREIIPVPNTMSQRNMEVKFHILNTRVDSFILWHVYPQEEKR